MLLCLEKRKRKLGVHVQIYSYESRFCLLMILIDSQVSKSLKQRFLILLLCRPALHLSLSLSSLSLSLSPLSLSFISHGHQSLSLSPLSLIRSSDQLQQTVPIYTYFHTAMRSIVNGHACGCCAVCIKALIRIKPYIKS